MTPNIGSFERILVPVDFSSRSANALQFAVAIGSLWHAEVSVLHVWHSDLVTGVTVAKERAKNALRAFVAGLGLRGEVALQRRIDHGDPYLTTLGMARLASYDLIVVAGPEGPRANEDSVAKSLLATAPCAVLFVPPSSRPRCRSDEDRSLFLERVLVPLSLAGSELEALACAEVLARSNRAAVDVLVSQDTSKGNRALFTSRSAFERRTAYEVAQVDPVSAVQSYAKLSAFDLVVVASERVAIGGRPEDTRVERLALAQACPCLCLRE